MRLPSPKKVCKEVVCKGGPWSGKKVWFPVQEAGNPLSLPIRVRSWSNEVGRYDLNSGKWFTLEIDPECKKEDLL